MPRFKKRHLGKLDLYELEEEQEQRPSLFARIGEFVMGCICLSLYALFLLDALGIVSLQ